jgi:hypothetical protein
VSGGWAAQISDEAAEYLAGLMDEHQPGKGGWCRCGVPRCRRAQTARIELAIAGRLDVPAPWTVRPEPGRWP